MIPTQGNTMLTQQEEMAALKKICKLLESHIQAYSGRGMMGKYCYGICVPPHELVNCIEEAAIAGIRGAKFDSLGKSTIVYWPTLELNPVFVNINDDSEEEDGCINCEKSCAKGDEYCPDCAYLLAQEKVKVD